jgi:hypothetical protein
MREKIITKAVLDANRANANKPRGERSPAGRLAARRNPLKHGFYSRELILSDAEKRQVQSFSEAFSSERPPKTALQKTAFEEVTYCYGRVKVAARLEMRRASALLDASDHRETEPTIPEGTPVISRWYLSNRQELHETTSFLKEVMREFAENKRVREDLKEPLDRSFGVGFYDELTKWTPGNSDAIKLAEHLQKHARVFRKPLPRLDEEQLTKIVIDPEQGYQMVQKLLDLQFQHLRDLSASWEQRTAQTIEARNAVVDFSPRFFTTASRDFHRAIEWYLHLRKENL